MSGHGQDHLDLRTGRSADLLSATLVATAAPVVVCPAMHTEMWEHPAVEENIAVLRDRGVVIVPPEEGRLAGGDIGKGRLADPATVVEAVAALFRTGPLSERSVLITAGGTREPIDPVRYIGNRSSGKQGHALAEVAVNMGADVTLVTTANQPSSPSIERIQVETASEMHDAVAARSDTCDVVIMAAAVADFRPADAAIEKIKKADGTPTVGLEPTVDYSGLGWAHESHLGRFWSDSPLRPRICERMHWGKLERKGADLLVANDVSAPGVGFAHDTNAVTIFGSDGSVLEVSLNDKSAIATAVLEAATERLPTSESTN